MQEREKAFKRGSSLDFAADGSTFIDSQSNMFLDGNSVFANKSKADRTLELLAQADATISGLSVSDSNAGADFNSHVDNEAA